MADVDTGGKSQGPTVGKANSQYGADQIKVLEGLDAVRKRPGMYIGGTGVNALHHLVYEVVDNSIDEAMAGYATAITVSVEADGSCRVADDGRGIPVDPVKHEDPLLNGRPAVEVVMTKLHAGGKFQQEDSAYKVSGGLHGVGVSCVNALSEYLEVEVARDGMLHRMRFERGRVAEELRVVGPIPAGARPTGTVVEFRPDPEIFPDTDFRYETLENRMRELAFLNPGIFIRLTDERVGADGKPRSAAFKAENGLLEYVAHMMRGKTAVSSPVYIRTEKPEEYLLCEVALQYHDGYNETVLTFANNINNVDGGTHGQGFKTALTRTLNGYARKAGIIKDKDPVPTGEDLREGLVAIVSVKLPNPTFNNQPKEKLLNEEVEGFVAQAVSDALGEWLETHPAEAKRLCQKGIIAAQAREAARKARELTRRKTALDSGSMPHKLKDCKTKDVDRAELFIVEGDSAGGSATQGRDVETQAILPLRGKLLNVEKARIDKVLGFEEIRTLISALRVGIGAELDISRLRYGRVIIMTDADVDGSHIRTLLLTFFFRQMPELLRRGHIFVAQPPLYEVSRGGGKKRSRRYVLDERALGDTLTELGLEGARLHVRDTLGWTAEGVVPASAVNGEPRVTRMLEGAELRRAVRTLRRLAELVQIAERRGVPFADLLAARRDGRLPTHQATCGAATVHAWSEAEALAAVAARGWRLADAAPVEGAAVIPPMPMDAGELGEAEGDGEEVGGEAGGVSGGVSAGPVVGAAAGPDAGLAPLAPIATVRELHENRELERLFVELAELGLLIDDYALVQEESVTGERLPARFAWEVDPSRIGLGRAGAGAGAEGEAEEAGDAAGAGVGDASAEDEEASGGGASGRGGAGAGTASAATRTVEAASLASVLGKLHEIGRRGLEIKRFKGLGEMDAEQLWETTMDASRRTLMRVTWEQAGEADALFSVLMGEQVEPRRRFIEEHALEVKNLDV